MGPFKPKTKYVLGLISWTWIWLFSCIWHPSKELYRSTTTNAHASSWPLYYLLQFTSQSITCFYYWHHFSITSATHVFESSDVWHAFVSSPWWNYLHQTDHITEYMWQTNCRRTIETPVFQQQPCQLPTKKISMQYKRGQLTLLPTQSSVRWLSLLGRLIHSRLWDGLSYRCLAFNSSFLSVDGITCLIYRFKAEETIYRMVYHT
jgi:hypothetical protein